RTAPLPGTETRTTRRTTRRTTTRTTRASVACVLLLAALVLLPALGQTREFAAHEGMYGLLGRSVMRGEVWTPTLGGRAYTEKPPGFFWAEALCGLARGKLDLVAARLPSVVATLAIALALLRLGRGRAGLLAAVAFLCCPLAVHAGRVARLDAMLAA